MEPERFQPPAVLLLGNKKAIFLDLQSCEFYLIQRNGIEAPSCAEVPADMRAQLPVQKVETTCGQAGARGGSKPGFEVKGTVQLSGS